MMRRDLISRPWHTFTERHQRIFSEDEEAAFVSFVRDNFTAPGLMFTDSDLREIAMNAFLTKYEDAGPELFLLCATGCRKKKFD
jgi:hypothetical protein